MDPFGENDHDLVDKREDEDPAAAFIAQERDQLAGLGDDDLEDGFNASSTMTNVRDSGPDQSFVNGNQNANDFFEQTEEEDGFRGQEQQQHNQWNGSNANGDSGSGGIFDPPKLRPSTPDKIRKWRGEQKERLEKKDADEEKKKQEQRSQAQRELQEWYELQEDVVRKAKKNNRDSEKEFVQQRDSDRPGEEWERVARLCDFNPKSAKGTKDISRLRSIILQLKQA